MTHDELIKVIEAHRDGKQIQLRYHTVWRDIDVAAYRIDELLEDEYKFRVKPEPRRGFFPDTFVYETRETAERHFPQAEIVEFVEVVR